MSSSAIANKGIRGRKRRLTIYLSELGGNKQTKKKQQTDRYVELY